MNNILRKKEYQVIALFVLLKIFINTLFTINSGFDGDEIMHIDSGNHLAWGYISIQPLIGLLSWVQNLFQSDSFFIHHLFTHLSSILIIIFSGLLTLRIGGSWKSVLLCLTCIIVAPGFNISNYIFTPLVFEQLFWILSFYTFVLYCKKNNANYLIYTACLLGVGFMSKISLLILVAGIGLSIVIYKRELFSNRKAWIALLLFLLIISPNLYWQYQNNFPSYLHMTTLYDKVLIQLDFVNNIKLLLLTTHPLTLVVWVVGLIIAPFLSKTKKIRMATTTLLITFLILIIFRGQFHYFFPTILLSLCMGSVIWEEILESKKRLLYSYCIILLASACYLLPHFMPLLPLDQYIQLNGLDNKETKNTQLFFTQQSIEENKKTPAENRIPINFESYYTDSDWKNLAQSVHEMYQQLPPKQQQKCYIWTRCYTQAAALNLYGKKHKLPFAFSQHGVYYEWIPKFDKKTTLLIVAHAEHPADSTWIGDFFRPSFQQLTWKKAVFSPHARQSSNAYFMLYLGEGLKYNSDTLKLKYKKFMFE